MPTVERLRVGDLRAITMTFGRLLDEHQQRINRLNVYPVPDGDTGTNMARTLGAVNTELASLPSDASLGDVCRSIAHGSLMGARGNSGVIVSQILRGMVGVLAHADAAGPDVTAAALRAGATAAYGAVMKPVEGTILTVMRRAADGAEVGLCRGGSLTKVLDEARCQAADALAATPDLLPVLRDAGVVDAGGSGLLLMFDAALHVVDGRALPEPPEPEHDPVPSALSAPPSPVAAAGTNRFEVMFLLEAPDPSIGRFKDRWGSLGDSIVVVGGDGMWNCHIHTDDIGSAIESGLAVGRPSRIRVTDLAAEVAEEHDRRQAALITRRPRVTTAVVAVSAGAGLSTLFGELGVQEVVLGGQTMNPSTAELLAAVERAPSDAVVVLPNNANIVAVAEQVRTLTDKTVLVVATRSAPEALGALVVYDPEGAPEDNAASMRSAAAGVRSGAVTQAIRASASPAGPIHEGDWLGVAGHDGIVAVDRELEAVIVGLLDAIVDEAAGIVTVLTGEGSSDALTARVRTWVAQHRRGVDVEVHAGGQPLYPYLFGVE